MDSQSAPEEETLDSYDHCRREIIRPNIRLDYYRTLTMFWVICNDPIGRVLVEGCETHRNEFEQFANALRNFQKNYGR